MTHPFSHISFKNFGEMCDNMTESDWRKLELSNLISSLESNRLTFHMHPEYVNMCTDRIRKAREEIASLDTIS